MNQAFLARQNLYKSTKVHQTSNLTGINLARLSLSSNALNHFDSLVSRFAIYCCNEDAASIVDIDLSTGLVHNLLDGLAAGANNLSNLVRINIDSGNLGSILAELLARLADAFHHLAHDELTATFSLSQSLGKDILVDAINLNIHLDSSDTLFGACYLKVHIAQSILQALDIGQNGEVFAILNQAHSYTSYRSLNGHACIHQGQSACANRAHGGGTIGFQNLGYQTNCIGEFFLRGNYGLQSTLSQCTVTDLATARAAQRLGFAYGIRREIIVVDVTLGFFCTKAIQNLCFTQGSQSQNIQDLGLTTSEQGAAMRTSQQTYLAGYRTNLVQLTTIRTNLVHGNGATNDFLNQLLGDVSNVLSIVRIFLQEYFSDFCFNLSYILFALQLVSVHQGVLQLLSTIFFNFSYQFSRRNVNRYFHLGLADFSNDFFLEFNQLLDYAMAKPNSVQHGFFGYFLRTCFNHQDSILGAGNSQIQLRNCCLSNSRVDDEFAINQAYTHTGDRTFKGNIRNRQCTGCTDHSRHIGSIVGVNGNSGSNDLYIVVIALGEHGANRTVNQAAGQNSLLAGTTFTFNKTTGDLTHSVHLFFKINSQREKVNTLTRGFGAGNGNYYGGITIAY